MNTKNRNFYCLVGLPGSGKSTWRQEFFHSLSKNIPEWEFAFGPEEDWCFFGPEEDWCIISSDDFIDRKAKEVGLTYSDVFKTVIKEAGEHTKLMFQLGLKEESNIIHDQTNLSVNKRRSLLSQIPDNYHKVAVIFKLDKDELNRRLEKRFNETGKYIPSTVIEQMEKSYIEPTLAEGFDEIIIV